MNGGKAAIFITSVIVSIIYLNNRPIAVINPVMETGKGNLYLSKGNFKIVNKVDGTRKWEPTGSNDTLQSEVTIGRCSSLYVTYGLNFGVDMRQAK